jgi:tRNA modification GTPase
VAYHQEHRERSRQVLSPAGDADTIAAIATPAGVGSVGIVRLSGTASAAVAAAVLGSLPAPRKAHFADFLDSDGTVIDQGIALYFPAPHSFTGENVLELQCHGGPVILDRVMGRVLALGVRAARPGEFSERAFLNGKLDLVQAEAIADLIESRSEQAARLAMRSLQGEFSQRIEQLQGKLTELRAFVEAAVDFPEEEVDFLADPQVQDRLDDILAMLQRIQRAARQGQLLRDGMTIVIAGRPNAGKSSLLNALAGRESAIVTQVPGTTRDLLRERILIDGMPLHVVDTAGLRDAADEVEQEGIRRARAEISRADRVLWVYDAREPVDATEALDLPTHVPLTLVRNKIDLTGGSPQVNATPDGIEIAMAARSGEGLDLLRDHLKDCVGFQGTGEGEYMARRRPLDALRRVGAALNQARSHLGESVQGELLAEELRQSQKFLSEITGEFLPDDLLGEIFGRFCIGK